LITPGSGPAKTAGAAARVSCEMPEELASTLKPSNQTAKSSSVSFAGTLVANNQQTLTNIRTSVLTVFILHS
jgi:hypothetical protein